MLLLFFIYLEYFLSLPISRVIYVFLSLTYVSIVVLTREYRSSNDKRAEGADGRERRQAGKHGENVSRPTAAGERHPGPELSERRDSWIRDCGGQAAPRLSP